jgi:solute carrier family 35 (UDP-galactose transporter), member B1
MLIGVLLAGKRYTIQKYFFVLMIVVGVVMFIYDGSKQKDEEGNHHLGLLLIGMSLMCDGVSFEIYRKLLSFFQNSF